MGLKNRNIISISKEITRLQTELANEADKLNSKLSFIDNQGDKVTLKIDSRGGYFELSDGRNIFVLKVENINKTCDLFLGLQSHIKQTGIEL